MFLLDRAVVKLLGYWLSHRYRIGLSQLEPVNASVARTACVDNRTPRRIIWTEVGSSRIMAARHPQSKDFAMDDAVGSACSGQGENLCLFDIPNKGVGSGLLRNSPVTSVSPVALCMSSL